LYRYITQPQPLVLEQIQQQVLDSDTILLEYFLGEDNSFLWVVTSDSFRSYVLPNAATLNELRQKFNSSLVELESLTPNQTAIAELSSAILPEGIFPQSPQTTVLVVPDGRLNYFPYNLLYLPQTQNYLFEKYSVIHSPSASAIDLIRKYAVSPETPTKELIIFADPVFNEQDDRVTVKGNLAADGWPRVPYTREEAQGIVSLYPSDAVKYFSGFESNLTNLQQSPLNQYRILHLATHGFYDEQNPTLSGLVLSLVNPQGETENGYLRFTDIFNLNLLETQLR
jgi:CHAT domain-containing protein